MSYIWIIDAGHGGLNAQGKYTTDPKIGKKHTFPDGHTIYEGVVNRGIANLVEAHLRARGIKFVRAYDPVQDWPLSARVTIANKMAQSNKVIYLSIHSNAGGGRGFEVFTSPGQTKSDKAAQVFCDVYAQRFPDFPLRKDLSDGDSDKESSFYVLKNTTCPAVLVENLFFDERSQANYLESEAGQSAIAGAIVEAIQIIEQKGL